MRMGLASDQSEGIRQGSPLDPGLVSHMDKCASHYDSDSLAFVAHSRFLNSSRRLGQDLIVRPSVPIDPSGVDSVAITITPPGPIAESVENEGGQSLVSEVATAYAEQLAEYVGVSQLRGVGVYLTESTYGIPPVMWHFLRNIEAVHEFAILLQVG